MKEVKKQLVDIVLDALGEAEGGSGEGSEPDTNWLNWPTLAQYEADAKGEQRFTAEEHRIIGKDRRRLWMLAQAQNTYRPSLGERVINAIRNFIGPSLQPIGGEADTGEAFRYPVLIERPDGTVRADSQGVITTLAPAFTDEGYLVGQISLPPGVLEEFSKRGYKTELRILAISPRIEELASLEATPKVSFHIPVPSPFRDDEHWKSITPGGALPFAFSVRITQSPGDSHERQR